MQKKIQYISVGVGLTLLIIVGTLAIALTRVEANEISSVTKMEVNQNADYTAIVQPVTINQQELNQRQKLIDSWSRNIIIQPGWLRTIVHYVQEKEELSVIPNGITIPNDYTLETWYLLDHNRSVTTMLSVMQDEDGNTVQFGTFQNGVWFNSTLNEIYEGREPVLNWGTNLLETPSNVINQEIVPQNGRQVMITTIRELSSPVPLDDLGGELVSGFLVQEERDVETGEPLRVTTTILLADGTEQPFSQYEYIVVERPTTLPLELDDLLQQGITFSEEVE